MRARAGQMELDTDFSLSLLQKLRKCREKKDKYNPLHSAFKKLSCQSKVVSPSHWAPPFFVVEKVQ